MPHFSTRSSGRSQELSVTMPTWIVRSLEDSLGSRAVLTGAPLRDATGSRCSWCTCDPKTVLDCSLARRLARSWLGDAIGGRRDAIGGRRHAVRVRPVDGDLGGVGRHGRDVHGVVDLAEHRPARPAPPAEVAVPPREEHEQGPAGDDLAEAGQGVDARGQDERLREAAASARASGARCRSRTCRWSATARRW